MKNNLGRKRIISWLLAIILSLSILPAGQLEAHAVDTTDTTLWTDLAESGFNGGDGSSGNPYQIASAYQLAYLSKVVNASATASSFTYKCYILTASINLSAHIWTPIGNQTTGCFNGVFNGNGKTITGLTITSYGAIDAGLFGYANTTCVFKNLTLDTVEIASTNINAGALVGRAINTTAAPDAVGKISDITVKNAKISAKSNVGGIAGASMLPMENCVVTNATLTASADYVGGIAAKITNKYFDSTITNCAFSGTATAVKTNVGGIIGNINMSAISATYSCEIFGCFSNAILSGTGGVGGILGLVSGAYVENVDISNCYSTGKVTATGTSATAYAGGIIGSSTTSQVTVMEDCYTTSEVAGTGGIWGYGSSGLISISGSAALNNSLTVPSGIDLSDDSSYARIITGKWKSDGLSGNYAFDDMVVRGTGGKLLWISYRSDDLQNGADISSAELTNSTTVPAPFCNWSTEVWNISPGTLPTLKKLPDSVTQSSAIPSYISSPSSVNWEFSSFDTVSASETVICGTTADEVMEDMPVTISGTLSDGQTAMVSGITWACANYDTNKAGDYTFQAVLPSGVTKTDAATLPTATITVIFKYYVTLDTRGGTLESATSPIQVDSNDGIISASPTVKRTGYTFGGWYYEDDEGEAQFNFGAAGIGTAVTKDMTLYAKWTFAADTATSKKATLTQGTQTIDLTALGFDTAYSAAATVYTVSREDGYTIGAVVTAAGSLTVTVPSAGDYELVEIDLVSTKQLTTMSTGSATVVSAAYMGAGTSSNPLTALADLTHDASDNSFGVTWIALDIWAGYAATSSPQYAATTRDETLRKNVLFNSYNSTSGELIASLKIDGTSDSRERIDPTYKGPMDLSFRIDPTEDQISSWLDANTLYSSTTNGDYSSRKQTMLDKTAALPAKHTLLAFDNPRETFGPMTLTLASTGFTQGEKVYVEYLGGTGGSTKYHGGLPAFSTRVADEMSYVKYYSSSITVGENGSVAFDIYNMGMFAIVAEKDVIASYTVTFHTNGGSSVDTQTVYSGYTSTKPTDPTRENYTFAGWYTDEGLTTAFDFSTQITASLDLYAKWTASSSGSGSNPGSSTDEKTTYTVHFAAIDTVTPVSGETPTTTTIDDQTVAKGNTATQPRFVVNSNSEIAVAWYTDINLTKEYDFSTPVTSDLTLYPRWVLYAFKNTQEPDSGSGTEADPYKVHIANSVQSKITWKALNNLANGTLKSGVWEIYATDDNKKTGNIKYQWVINTSNISTCDVNQPYYLKVTTTKVSTGNVQAALQLRTAIEGTVTLGVDVSDYIPDETTVSISYVNASCDDMVVHTDAETGEWQSAGHMPSSFYSGGTAVVKNGLLSFDITHGGSYLFKYTEAVKSSTSDTSISLAATTDSSGKALISMTTDQMDEAITQSLANAASTGAGSKAVIKLNIEADESAKSVEASIPGASISKIVTSGIQTLNISTPVAAIALDADTLKGIAEKAGESNVSIIAEAVEASTLSDDAQAKVGDHPVYSFSVTAGGTAVSSFDGNVTVAIPYTPAAGEDTNAIVIYYVKADGTLELVKDCVYDSVAGTISFTTTHFSTYAIGYNKVSFKDVSGWYADYVTYLSSRGIMNGKGSKAFAPNESITRAELAKILANLAGADLSGYTASSFTDVETSDWYFGAVQWAYENGIVTGSNGKFDPTASVTRQDIAVMLMRYAEKLEGAALPETASAASFSDESSIASYAKDAVTAMQRAGIISGRNDGAFDPASSATRAEAAKMIAVLMQLLIG